MVQSNIPSFLSSPSMLNIVFVIQYPNVLSTYYPVIKRMEEHSEIRPYLWLIPNHDKRLLSDNFENIKWNLERSFPNHKIVIDLDGNKLPDLRPDVVFFQTPYDSQRPLTFQSDIVSTYARIAYIPYGVNVADAPEYHYGLRFYDYCWKIFFGSPMALKMCRDYVGQKKFLEMKDKYVVSGSPKIEAIRNHIEGKDFLDCDCWNLPRTSEVKRIIWAPHWSFEWNISGDGIVRNGYSQFLRYYKFFLDLVRNNSNIDLILRAHPLTYHEVVNRNLLSRTAVQDYVDQINSLPNAKVDNAAANNELYLDLFFSSDAMITDGVSFLAEYPLSGNPLLHTVGTDNPPRFNDYGKNLVNAFYTAYDETGIINFLDHVVFQGKDDMKLLREKAFNKDIFIPEGGASRIIIQTILEEL